VDGQWKLDPHHPTEKDIEGNENNVLTIDDLLKLPVVETTASASSGEKETEETTPPVTTETTAESTPAEEATTTTSVTDSVKDKIMEVTAAGSAAIVGFMTIGHDEKESSPIPGSFPDTPLVEKTEAASTAPVQEVAKTDDEPVPGIVVPVHDHVEPELAEPTTVLKQVEPTLTEPVETIAEPVDDVAKPVHDNEETTETKGSYDQVDALETGAAATAAGGFAAALAADKEANTAPTHTTSNYGYIPSNAETSPDECPRETDNSFGILPVPSATAPEGTKPLAKSTYAEPMESLAPEPVAHKDVAPLPSTTEFEPVNNDSNLISSTEKTEALKVAALESSHHTAQTAAKALAEDAPAPSLDANATLAGLSSGAGVTAIGTATDQEYEGTGLSRLVAKKEDDTVNVDATAKAAHIEPAITLDGTQMSKPIVETIGTSGSAAVASTPVTVSVPTRQGVQEVTSLGTAIVTDGTVTSETLQSELSANGKTTLPEGALAHLAPEAKTEDAPATPEKSAPVAPKTPEKDGPPTPAKNPVNQSSAAGKKERPISGVSQTSEKKKNGLFKKIKKFFK
jgi:hypothetical protein